MARATGARASLKAGFEATYGTAATDFGQYPFYSNDLGGSQELEEDTPLGYGRNSLAPTQGDFSVEGSIEVPVDVRNFGFWLKAGLGAPTTVDNLDGTFTHSFESGASTLPSITVEKGMTDINQFELQTGVMINTMAFSFERGGSAKCTLNAIGKDEAVSGTTVDATPSTHTFERYSGFHGSITSGGSTLGSVTSGDFTFSNGLDPVRTIRNDRSIDGVDLGTCMVEGQFTVRYEDATLMNKAINGEAIDLVFEYQRSANEFVKFTMHEVYLPKPKTAIEGANGIEATFNFKASYNETAGTMLTVELKNDVATY